MEIKLEDNIVVETTEKTLDEFIAEKKAEFEECQRQLEVIKEVRDNEEKIVKQKIDSILEALEKLTKK